MWFQANCPTGWGRLCLVMMMPLSCWWTGAVYVTRSVSWRVSCVFRDVFASFVMCLFHDVCVCFMMCMFHECVFHDVSISWCSCFVMCLFGDMSVSCICHVLCSEQLKCIAQVVQVYSTSFVFKPPDFSEWLGSIIGSYCLMFGVFLLCLWAWMLGLSYLWCIFTMLVSLDAGFVLSLVCFHCSCDPGCWFCLMQVDGYHKEEEKVKFERVKVDIEHLNLGKRLSGWLLSRGGDIIEQFSGQLFTWDGCSVHVLGVSDPEGAGGRCSVHVFLMGHKRVLMYYIYKGKFELDLMRRTLVL